MINNFFTDPNLKFEKSLKGLTLENINTFIPQAFYGKEYFIEFYKNFNGGYFYGGAFFYRDIFNEVNEGDYNLIEIEAFNFISVGGEDSPYLLSISDILKYRRQISQDFFKFTQENLPFAGDAGDNDFWINFETGNVKYTRSTDINCLDNIIDIAPSFRDFCMNIQSTRR